jgi:uncharacterized FlaG/YvyC family protein
MDKSKSEAAQGRNREECFQEEYGMSSPILPTQGSITVHAAHSAGAARRTDAANSAASLANSAALRSSVSLQTFPSSPPQTVLDEMASAARVHDTLRAQGRELHFAHDSQSGRMTIEVRDNGGQVLRTISPSEALEVAAGKPLE